VSSLRILARTRSVYAAEDPLIYETRWRRGEGSLDADRLSRRQRDHRESRVPRVDLLNLVARKLALADSLTICVTIASRLVILRRFPFVVMNTGTGSV
jgi:hypothetical protein